MIKLKDIDTGAIYFWSLNKVIQEINRDRSENWINYDQSDWREGWDEWVEGDCYTMLTEKG
tara:strand:+ start:2621 stop:2803 length:183 start_codon:yes stop_codon:yes gene_type:complete